MRDEEPLKEAMSVQTMESPRPFCFLDLPAELRMMVYERIPIRTKHYPLKERDDCMWAPGGGFEYTLVEKTVSMDILRVCKQVHREAFATMKDKLIDIFVQPAKIIVPEMYLWPMTCRIGPLQHLIQFSTDQCEDQTLTFNQYWEEEGYEHKAWHDGESPYVLGAHLRRFVLRSVLNMRQRTHLLTGLGDDLLPPIVEIALTTDVACCLQQCGQNVKDFTRGICEHEGDLVIALRIVRDTSPALTAWDERRYVDRKIAQGTQEFNMYKGYCRLINGGILETEEWSREWMQGEHYCEAGKSTQVHIDQAAVYKEKAANVDVLDADEEDYSDSSDSEVEVELEDWGEDDDSSDSEVEVELVDWDEDDDLPVFFPHYGLDPEDDGEIYD